MFLRKSLSSYTLSCLTKSSVIKSLFNDWSLQGHQTVHPSMYEDDRRSTGRLRYSIRRPHSSSSCNGRLASLSESRSNNCRALVTSCISTTPERRDLPAGASGATDIQVYSNAITKPNKSEIQRSYVSVGRHFQARVDEWSVSGLDSDAKWLGTCIWPLENEDALDDTIGKGRQDCCSCDILIAGSVECIRFHIAEKRMELKRGLGDVFFHWRFNQMGEEVSLRWTEREEKRFKELMISDSERFWENAAKCFRGKKRVQLVSYYFNVFLINRKRYQNRVTPRHVDSDDEGAFGSVGNSFGRAAVTWCGSDIMICSQNSQCNDFD